MTMPSVQALLPESVQEATPAEAPSRSKVKDTIAVLIGVWALLGMAAALLWPLGLSTPVLFGLGASSVLTLLALPRQNRWILLLSTIALTASVISALVISPNTLSLLALALWGGGMWMIQCTLAIRQNANVAALACSVGVVAVSSYLVGTVDAALGMLPLAASGALLLLGIARLGVKSDVVTSPVHYCVWWTVMTGCALVVQQVYPDLTLPSRSVTVASAALAAGAAFVWSLDRGMDIFTGLAIIAAFALIYNAGFLSTVEAESFISAGLVVPAVFGAAIFAAGLAMCVRGLKRNETPTMLLGAGAMLVEVLLLAKTMPVEPELAALTLLMAGIISTWLFALRA